jgi:hypothetical protein
MDELTVLDHAHAEMEAAVGTDGESAARLRFYERLADCELFLMLTEEARGENISPELFQTEEGAFLLGFDREERLSGFAGRAVPYAALSGRVIAGMLSGEQIGLAVNPGAAPSSILIPPEALTWLHDTLGNAPEQVQTRLSELVRPTGLPDRLLEGLDARLAGAAGLAATAWLAGVRYDNGGAGFLLGFVDASDRARDPLAKAVAEALIFSGIDAGVLDVGFFASDDPMVERLARVGMRYDIPELKQPEPWKPVAPGSDPEKPPRLK